jgi:hypothetical protein
MIAVANSVKRAEAVPQPAGSKRPAGSVLYLCNGLNEFQTHCGRLLFVWVPPAFSLAISHSARFNLGRIEIKCRACKTLNMVVLGGTDTP